MSRGARFRSVAARQAPINCRRCETAHTSSGTGTLFQAPLPPRARERCAKEGAMPSSNFWSRSLSRAELDQRAREARLRLERLERLLISRTAAKRAQLRRLLFLLGSGGYRRGPQKSRVGRPLSDRRPSRMPPIPQMWHPEEAVLGAPACLSGTDGSAIASYLRSLLR